MGEEMGTPNTPMARVLRMLEVTAIVFSVITGASSTGIILWRGGAMAHMIATHEVRLSAIESRGSPTMSEHIKLDDEREKRTRERLEKLEEIFKIALDLRTDIGRISQKVDDLKERYQK